LNASAFSIGTMATTPAHRILYDNATGTLTYDSDGSGIAGATVFARLSAGLAGVLTADCFTVI
jgi:Ca2+-binding RTX toxin-like protein